ncbi:2Fe-2S iron-sulfur cluster-binding protein [Candidatus Pollutiaquabacter sp.]|uniref:2Fe-2S iron-sulfur cluster-binding protein n=1 Tax=Candidatus Pollutiaquabacter sp. TaxID=3416354 RepID=UPI003D0F3ABE
MAETINLKLKIWRQKNHSDRNLRTLRHAGREYAHVVSQMMDVLNDRLIREGEDPVAFDHDCREGICGMCSMYINGRAHGPLKGTTTCQLHMRHFSDGETVTIEPWRAEAFPVIKDLVVDRTAFDKIIAAGGYISANTGNAPDANAIPIEKAKSDESL